MRTQIEQCCVNISKCLMDGMQAINDSRVGIALVLDDSGCLVGTLTDGDVRRAILKGATIDSPLVPFVYREYTWVSPDATRDQVLDLMQARTINHVPIVDSNHKLMGLHLLHELIGTYERDNWAVIMAGGKGERLRPITKNLPKPMIEVAGRPILERLILHLVGFGIKNIFISINYLGHIIQNHFGNGKQFGCNIRYLIEKDFLGTGGGLSLLPEKPKDSLLVMNGDLLTQVNLDQMLSFHEENSFVATLGVKRYIHQVPYGCVILEENNVSRIEEKPSLERIINTGIYVLDPILLSRVKKIFFPITDLFEDCLRRGEPLGAFEVENRWMDIGQHDQLLKARNGC